MIERQKTRYGWEFIFLGANIDAVETAGRFGIDADRAQNYHADSEGVELNFRVMSEAVAAPSENALRCPRTGTLTSEGLQHRGGRR